MDAPAYTLVLTNGAHSVSPETATKVRRAIENGDRLVDVQMEFFGDENARGMTAIVTAHVMAIAEDWTRDLVEHESRHENVHRLRRVR
jgi:hypothetical protein